MTGMGEIAAIADSASLATAIEKVLDDPRHYIKPRAEIEEIFSLDQTIGEYESLYGDLIGKKARESRVNPANVLHNRTTIRILSAGLQAGGVTRKPRRDGRRRLPILRLQSIDRSVWRPNLDPHRTGACLLPPLTI